MHLIRGCMSVLAILMAFSATALAQDGLLDGDPLLEGQLEERKATKKVEQVDPDPKFLKQVMDAQTAMEALLNALGDAGQKFAKIEAGANKISSQFVKAQDAYTEAHAAAVEAYVAAHAAGDEAKKKKLAKKIKKLRNTYLKKMKKINRSADKLDKAAKKLQAKIDSGKAELSDEGE